MDTRVKHEYDLEEKLHEYNNSDEFIDLLFFIL